MTVVNLSSAFVSAAVDFLQQHLHQYTTIRSPCVLASWCDLSDLLADYKNWVPHRVSSAVFKVVIALNQTCCKPVLYSSTEQWGLHFAKSSVTVLWCWGTAHLYEEQISIGVMPLTHTWCAHVLYSSTEQRGLHFAKNSVTVLWCWGTAHLYEEQSSIGVIALKQTCCKPVLHSSTDQWGLHLAKNSVAVQCC